MAPQKEENESGNLLKMLMSEIDDLDLSDLDHPDESSPADLIEPGYEISKLFAIIEFGLRHANDEDGLLAGTDMMDREAARKAINGNFLFEVASSSSKDVSHFRVDMRSGGTIIKGKGPAKPKPDVTIRVADKDMVALAMGKVAPQSMFLKGRLKPKGNIMLGLKMNNVLQKEISKLSKL
ncbi:hypothetical protein BDZ90DRAFT_230073 [Jaminaea rosea]|uniref:SCP2 domain-containing protein n=1 Tax=Jaminaea rosea TaxID=1569628 RepID=A0A316V249_9BASI|nr:hypothetical protein BDZ90DRAFT_230073 [Jaminaea rosea]PWN31078.1 hypothetical protein BDZ90DRAFT_230073 [Jaminaea rosea]